MKRRIPYGVAHYPQIVEGGYYFVDKTAYIRPLEEYVCPCYLRPRRFGKSLWCSVLEHYYDLNFKKDFKRLFGSTAIGKDPTPARNKYMVLRLDFSRVNADGGVAEIRRQFDLEVIRACRLLAETHGTAALFRDVHRATDAMAAIQALLRLAESRRTPPLYVIIDEYDNFTNVLVASNRDADYRALTTGDSFLRGFYKCLKAGVGVGAIAHVYMTGVLPITLDDMTSGFNIADVVSQKRALIGMLGFSHAEMVRYVDEIFADYGFDAAVKPRVLTDLRENYDNYRFLPSSQETFFNSTILSCYLRDLVLNEGVPPPPMTDRNVRTDICWFERLAGTDAAALTHLQAIVERGEPQVVRPDAMGERINALTFISPENLSAALFHLGMLTYAPDGRLVVPNLGVARVLGEYYNALRRVSVPEVARFEMVSAFKSTRDWSALFAAWWKEYVRRLPAAAFVHMREHFFQFAFYNFCADWLSDDYSFRVEENLPSGQCDFAAIPRLDRPTLKTCVLEYKYTPKLKAGEKPLAARRASAKAFAQVRAYAADVKREYADWEVETALVDIVGNKGYRWFADRLARKGAAK